MVKDLVAYAVARINIKRTTAINQNVCPRVSSPEKELQLPFGDYCEVFDSTDITAASQSIPCVALYPNGNSTGSWTFMNLKTKQATFSLETNGYYGTNYRRYEFV